MRGNGVIVLRQENHGFHEHGSLQGAKAEARRLAETLGGTLVVYVPVAVITPAPKTVERSALPDFVREELRGEGDDLPF